MSQHDGSGGMELLLIRHAKSAWDRPGVPDHDRDLAPRGIKAAKRIGKELAARGLVPDLVLCSTAKRAQRSWALIAGKLGRSVTVQDLRGLYLAAPGPMLALIKGQEAGVRRLAVVGH